MSSERSASLGRPFLPRPLTGSDQDGAVGSTDVNHIGGVRSRISCLSWALSVSRVRGLGQENMEEQRAAQFRLISWRVLALAILTVAALAFAWSHGAAPQIQAGAASVDLSVEVVGATCDTKGVNPTKCEVDAGSQFTVRVSINSVSGLPDVDTDTKAGYLGIQVRLNYSAGLTLKQQNAVDEIVWPDCGNAAELKAALSYLAGCGIGSGANESVYTGAIVDVMFTCNVSQGSQEEVILKHGVPDIGNPLGDTHIIDEATGELAEAGSESLTINCAPQPVGGIAELPDVDGAVPLEATDASGGNLVVAGVTVASIVSAVTALGVAAWYMRRRWAR